MRKQKTVEKVEPGKKFGQYTVLYLAESRNHSVYWHVRCNCGNEKDVRGSALLSGSSVSCGCKRRPYKIAGLEGERQRFIETKNLSAKGRGLEFDLGWEEFLFLIRQPCVYCGSPPKDYIKTAYTGRSHKGNIPGKKYFINLTAGGIDRKDNTIGYVLSNCVPCCFRCNHMKSNLEIDEFLSHVTKIYEFMGNQIPDRSSRVS